MVDNSLNEKMFVFKYQIFGHVMVMDWKVDIYDREHIEESYRSNREIKMFGKRLMNRKEEKWNVYTFRTARSYDGSNPIIFPSLEKLFPLVSTRKTYR